MSIVRLMSSLRWWLLGLGLGGALFAQPPWQDPTQGDDHRLTPTAHLFTQPNSPASRRSLAGRWAFRWMPQVTTDDVAFAKPAYDDRDWDSVNVPGHWQLQGAYDAPRLAIDPPADPRGDHPCGLYRTRFDLPRAWRGQRILLHLDGVAAACQVWTNGRYVGYAAPGGSSAAFDLTAYLRSGQNLLALRVMHRAAGTAASGWQLSGLFRDVALVARPNLHLHDLQVITDFDQQYRNATLHLDLDLRSFDPDVSLRGYVQVELRDAEARLLVQEEIKFKEKAPQLRLRPAFEMRTPRPWSAERPYLYQLLVTVQDKKGNPLESWQIPVGFRELAVQQGQWLLNGQPFRLRGVHYQAFDPQQGYAGSRERLLADLRQMKQHNVNALFLHRGPQDGQLYELCDQLGLYVIDGPAGTDAAKTALAQGQAVVAQHRNHPSVLAWALNQPLPPADHLPDLLRALWRVDSTRPLLLPQAAALPNEAVEGLALLYHSPQPPARPDSERVHVWANAGLAAGEGLARLTEQWAQATAAGQGGWVGQWADQALLSMRSNPATCYQGLVNADGRPQPELAALKRTWQAASLTLLDAETGQVQLTNQYDFLAMAWLDLHWQLLADGEPIQQGQQPVGLLAPGQAQTFSLGYALAEAPFGAELTLTLSLRSRQDQPWAPAGHEVAWQQVALRAGKPPPRRVARDSLVLIESATGLEVQVGDLQASFDKGAMQIQTLRYRGRDLLAQAPQPALHRTGHPAQLDTLAFQLRNVVIDRPQADAVSIRYEGVMPGPQGTLAWVLHYQVHASGELTVEQSLYVQGSWPAFPRVGLAWPLPAGLTQLRWYGLGPTASYLDRRAGVRLGRFRQSLSLPSALPWRQPQGSHFDTRWLRLTDEAGVGLEVIGTPTFAFTAALTEEAPSLTARQRSEPTPTRKPMLWLDAAQAGLAPDAPGLPPQTYHLRLRVRPVAPGLDGTR